MSDEEVKADWFAMSTQILADEKVEVLIERHGHVAFTVVTALMSQAMLQRHGGTVKRTFRLLAADAYTDKPTVKEVIETASEVGFLDLREQDELTATVHLTAWKRWQATFRKQKSRAAKKANGQANVTPGHAESHAVTSGHSQDRTQQDKTEHTEQKKKASGKPSEFDAWLDHYHQVTGRTTVTGSKPARQAFAARRKEGRNLEELKAATVGCHGDEFCRENGHDVPETILRASKINRYIALASKTAKPSKYDNATQRVAA